MNRLAGIVLTALVLLALPPGSRHVLAGQNAGVHMPESADDTTLRLTVHPAAEPRPALKYQLLPRFLDRTPGNAAVDYGKVAAEQSAVFGNDEWWEENWTKRMESPLAELRGEKLELPMIFETLDRAARRERCGWQVPIREGNFYRVLLPEVQQVRAFARLLQLRARIQIANGRFDEALYALQTGYALAEHVGEGPTLIHGLVGISICVIMSDCVLQMTQQPDTPNVYWALTVLPRPLIGGRQGIEAEMNAVALTFPELRDVDRTERTPEEWSQALGDFWHKFVEFSDGPDMLGRPETLTALTIKGYPKAKRDLIERGLPAAEVEAMPVPQVILLHTSQTYRESCDDAYRWFYVPYWQGCDGMEQAESRLWQAKSQQREVLPVASTLIPAVRALQNAIARCDREIAGLRTIEALRMYAAAHDGRLPETLDELTVPVPIDPVTGKPFVYHLQEGAGVIEGPPMPGLVLRMEVKVAR
ncbi:MAG TPA: hypothetical protein VMY37_22350 [Thermoguttaceae bacterium]|nr:hypothetical protein [Thermoguttaceae bacterium]